jgi:NOL1/NOP2/fmu family ribosome biogenesis protein
MQNLKILNSREKKEIYKQLKEQFGHEGKFDMIFLENTQKKVFVLSNDYAHIEISGLRVNNKALYFGKKELGGFRLSIEGSQMIKPSKNIIDLTEAQMNLWLMGEDIPLEGSQRYVIIRFKKDILGCGFHKDDNLRNMVPKERRLHSITL